MNDLYKLKASPVALEKNTVVKNNCRITLLTGRLLRFEFSESGIFENRATQKVLNRDFEPVDFKISESEEKTVIETDSLKIVWSGRQFSSENLTVETKGFGIWHYGERTENLKGTRRTLDGIDGPCALEDGLLSRGGFTLLDDSSSLVITDDGWVAVRDNPESDIYFFGYGHDYLGCLHDFYRLCGKTPMLPRYTLGNWWSRYYQYTEKTYKELMERFDKEQVPLTVAVVDMDWHWVDIDPKYGSGWTGYSWNTDFFPDPDGFLKWLHDRGMKVTLNVHPAEGIYAHEEMYEDMAKALGKDWKNEEHIPFSISDPVFLEAYFKYIHHYHEKRGVDFWWIDWQQGTATDVEGLDPLWMLNHFHYLDSGRDGKRNITFSRYAGPGSHRYPIGFSGDARIYWPMLDFQPYYTSTASNIGYGWWSHDIGGHTLGAKDDELAARWLQFGVFSPINRLHSTNNIFNGKEPWRYNPEIHHMMNEFLRLRHKMIPYTYTMNYMAYKDDLPIIRPMYYHYPEEQAAYEVKNQYFFGTELIVSPITSRKISGINRGKTEVWLPQGIYTDFFTGMQYRGGRKITMYRDINTIPVLAKAGAIIPMTEEIFFGDALKNPETLLIKVFTAADGIFRMYEDDNDTNNYLNGDCVFTVMKWDSENKVFTVKSADGNTSLIPQKRSFTLELYGMRSPRAVVSAGDKSFDLETVYDSKKNTVTVVLPELCIFEDITVSFADVSETDNNTSDRIFDFLSVIETDFEEKEHIWKMLERIKNPEDALIEADIMGVNKELIECLKEFLFAV